MTSSARSHRIRRSAPEAFRARQLRAVTLADYVKRAEEVTGVSRAVARYAWTGSWRTVRIAIDPTGFTALGDPHSDALWDELRPRIADHLEAVRLIGEDLELELAGVFRGAVGTNASTFGSETALGTMIRAPQLGQPISRPACCSPAFNPRPHPGHRKRMGMESLNL